MTPKVVFSVLVGRDFPLVLNLYIECSFFDTITTSCGEDSCQMWLAGEEYGTERRPSEKK